MKAHRLFAIILTALFFVPMSASPAEAWPIFAAIPAVAGWIAGASALAVGFAQLAFGLVTNMLINAIWKPDQQGGTRSLTTQSTTGGDTTPASFILGRYSTAGNLLAPEYSHGKNGYSPNDGGDQRWLTRILDVSDIPVRGLAHLLVDSNTVQLDMDPASADFSEYGRSTSNETYREDGKPYEFLYVKFYDGTQTVVDPTLIKYYGNHAQRPWSADMVLKGVAYAIVTLRYSQRGVWDTGKPNIKFIVDGIKLYDPRRDSTAGGTGTHRWNQPSTWGGPGDDNPVVMIYNILRGITISAQAGYETFIYGGGFDADDLDYANWSTAMNHCDALVGPAGNQRKRYTAGYEVKIGTPDIGGEEPLDVIDELLKACAGEVADVGGRVYIRCGPPELPTKFITDEDLLVSRPRDLDPFPQLTEGANAVQVHFRDPQSVWEPKEAPLKQDLQAQADDGRKIIAQVKFPAVTDHRQAQSLGVLLLKDNRRFRQHTLPLPPEGMMLRPLQVIDWTSVRHDYTAKDFEIGRLVVDPRTLAAIVAVRERDSGDAVWNGLNEDPVTPINPDMTQVGLTLASWAVEPASVPNQAGTGVRPALRILWDPDQPIQGVRYRIRLANTTAIILQGQTFNEDLGQLLISEGIIKGVNYEVQGAPIQPGRKIVWTPWTSVQAPDIAIPGTDVGGGGVDAEPPGQVTGLAAASGVRAIFLGWVARPRSEGVVNYYVYESETTTPPASPTFQAGNSTYFHRGRPTETDGKVDGVTKNYWVAAVDESGNVGQLSAMVTGSTISSFGVNAPLLAGILDRASLAAGLDIPVVHTGTALPTSFVGNVVIWQGKVYTWDTSKTPDAYTAEVAPDQIVGDLIAATVRAGAIGADQLAARVVLASKMAITEWENLQPVMEFEEETTEPFQISNGTMDALKGGTSGSGYIYLDKTTAAGAGDMTFWGKPGTMFKVRPGWQYWIDIEAKNGDGVTQVDGLQYGLRLFDGNKAYLSTLLVAGGPFDTSPTSYVERNGQVTIPSNGARFASLVAIIPGAKPAGTSLELDRLVARRANAAQLVVDGTLNASKFNATSVEALVATFGTAYITRANIVDLEVTRGKIANLAVNEGKIDNLAVSTLKIRGQAVTVARRMYKKALVTLPYGSETEIELGRLSLPNDPLFVTDVEVSCLVDGYGEGIVQVAIYRKTGTGTPAFVRLFVFNSQHKGAQQQNHGKMTDRALVAGAVTTYIFTGKCVNRSMRINGWAGHNQRIGGFFAAVQQFKR